MWDDMDERRLDNAIDAVARELTAGAPDDRFRGRVLARIRGREPFSRPLENGSRPLFWAAAAAVALIVVLLVPRHSPVPHQDVARTSDHPRDAGQISTAPAARDQYAEQGAPAAAPNQSAEPAGRRAGENAPTQSAVAALAPAPLESTSIAIAPLARPDAAPIESIELSPPEIAPIDVTPLPSDHGSDMRRPQ